MLFNNLSANISLHHLISVHLLTNIIKVVNAIFFLQALHSIQDNTYKNN